MSWHLIVLLIVLGLNVALLVVAGSISEAIVLLWIGVLLIELRRLRP